MRDREEIERSWDVSAKCITPNLDPGSSNAPEISGRHNHRGSLPSGVLVGQQRLPPPRSRNPVLGHLSNPINLTTLHSRW